MSSRRQKLLARVIWFNQSSLKHITEQITGKKYFKGGRYTQVSLYYMVLYNTAAKEQINEQETIIMPTLL